MILSPKWQQTYEEALQAMKDTTYSQYSLADVSTHHHTEELLEAALRNNRCSLRDIPVEKRTLRLCHVALECCHSINVQYIPKEYFDYNFSLKAASYCPATLSTILYFFRNGRWKEPYTAEDIRIIAEAACPVGLGQVRLNQFRNKEQELNGRTFERYCSDEYGFVHRAHSHIIRQALELYLHDAEKHNLGCIAYLQGTIIA